MERLPYMDEPWYELLRAACQQRPRTVLAAELGVAAPTLSQVLNGSGLYGTGQAGTARIAAKVVHLLGNYPCPHLGEQHGREVVVSAERCRHLAHRDPPIGSPRDLAHWQACRRCPHFAPSAPPPPRVVVPRKRKPEPTAADAAAEPRTASPAHPLPTHGPEETLPWIDATSTTSSPTA